MILEKEKKEQIMRILIIIGGILIFIMGMIELMAAILSAFRHWTSVMNGIIFIVIALILLLIGLMPGKPIPLNGALLLVFGIIIVILGIILWLAWFTIIGGILVVIAGLIGLLVK